MPKPFVFFALSTDLSTDLQAVASQTGGNWAIPDIWT